VEAAADLICAERGRKPRPDE